MDWKKMILETLILVIILLFIYNFLKIYVLDKIKVNKWIILALMVPVFFIPVLLGQENIIGTPWQYVQSGVFVILFLWFMDLSGWTAAKRKRDKDEVIKSKAKPSRIEKYKDIEVIKDKKKKKKNK